MPLVARSGLLAFVLLVALLHAVSPLDPTEQFVSEYATSEGGWLMRVAFLAWAASLAALSVLVDGRVTRAALVLAALGTVVAAVFATQTVGGELPAGVARTTPGRLHDLGTLAILAGLVVASLAQARHAKLATAALAFAFFAVPGVLVAVGWDAPGVGQRGIVLVGCAAQALLLSRAGGRAAPSAG